ncbi:MAG: hypothetical protein ACTSX6_00335 [Candidatus Heimdallarchaeaceae archaeon]
MVKGVDDLLGGEQREEISTKHKVTSYLSGKELHAAEELMNLGLGKNLDEIVKKGVKALYTIKKLEKTGDAVEKLLGGEVESSQGNQPYQKESDPLDEALEVLKKERTMKILKGEGGNVDLKEMFYLMMMERMMRPQENPEVASIRAEIMALRNSLEKLAENKKYEDLKSAMEKLSQNKGGDVDKLLQLWRERDKEIEAMRSELEKTRLEMMKTYLENELSEIKSRIQSASTEQDIAKLKTTLDAIKELQGHLGSFGKEKTDKELIADVLKSGMPVLKDVASTLAQKKEEEELRKRLIQKMILEQQSKQSPAVAQNTRQSIQPVKQNEQIINHSEEKKVKKSIDELLGGRIGVQ